MDADIIGMLALNLHSTCTAACLQPLANLSALNALNVSFNPLQSFPRVVGNLTALLELNLDYTGTLCML
jgi:Leucine-rich repeat (LRR) protein